MSDTDKVLQGRYAVVRKIGEGGMGAVYLAKDLRLESTVALKQTLFTDENLLRAFEREARLLAGLRHPALTKVSDHFTEGGSQYLVMDFISGDDLAAVLEKRRDRIPPHGEPKPFTQDEVLKWADQLLDALDYLHSHQPPIIHRDIKPQNLKITERDHVILLDFGLAKGAATQTAQLTSNKSIFGYTPTYAPIEQMQGSGTDPRSDLYSLGATLYHLITGQTPPDAMKRFVAVMSGNTDPLIPANALNGNVSPAVASVLAWSMSLKSDERPSNAAALRKAFKDAQQSSVATGGTDRAVKVSPPPVANYPATQVSYPQPANPQTSNSQTSNPQPSPHSSWPQPSQPSWPQPVHPNTSQPQPNQTWPQPSPNSTWPQPQMAVTQAQYPHAQPAKKSNKGVWIISGLLATGIIAVAIILIVAAYNDKGRSTDPSRLENSKSSGSTTIPGVNSNTSSTSKPDNDAISSSPPSEDARVDETLNHYVEALGGTDAIESVTSRVARGTLEMSDLEVGTVEIYARAPNKYALIMKMAGGVIRTGYNGSVGWAQEASEGVRRLEGAELAAMKRDAEFYKEIKLKELFSTINFNGKSSVNGRDAYVMTAIPPEGGSEKWYFDTKSGLLIRNDSERESMQGMTETESYIEQYKVIDGINLPVRLSQSNGVINLTIKIKDINHNVTINDSVFNMPSR
ncbi:MAG TPA: protein kinase [Blastocatellia bacterium]|nr:protein kinase [Blastocatellia bacterium]